MHTQINGIDMNTLEAKEQFSSNLLHPGERAFNVTVLYIVYKTIEKNRSITLNQLRWILFHEYMLQNSIVDGAVASLTSKTLFNCVSRWSPPRKSDTIHLRTKEEAAFDNWLKKTTDERPELLIFDAPNFSPAKNNQSATASAPQSKPE